MTIDFTEKGLAEINTSKAVYSGSAMVNSGFSDCTLRITYTAKMDSDNSVAFGDAGNPNDIVMVWKRTSDSYYDTLVDDAHVYTYGIDLTKMFSDGKGNFENVQFLVQNDSDGYYVKAERNESEGIYYVVEDNGSRNAEAPLTVVNTRGFDLPETGDHGTVVYTVLGIVAMAGAATVLVLTSRKKNSR